MFNLESYIINGINSNTNTLNHNRAFLFNRPAQDLALSFQSKYLGMSPWECPGFFAMLGFVEYEFGVEHPVGGLSEISQAMAKVVTQNGGSIKLEHEVDSLIIEKRDVKGVKLKSAKSLSLTT